MPEVFKSKSVLMGHGQEHGVSLPLGMTDVIVHAINDPAIGRDKVGLGFLPGRGMPQGCQATATHKASPASLVFIVQPLTPKTPK